jgi:hypothetical protein
MMTHVQYGASWISQWLVVQVEMFAYSDQNPSASNVHSDAARYLMRFISH